MYPKFLFYYSLRYYAATQLRREDSLFLFDFPPIEIYNVFLAGSSCAWDAVKELFLA